MTAEEIFEQQNAASLARVRAVAAATGSALNGERGHLLRRGPLRLRKPSDHRCLPPVRITDSGHRSGDASEPVGSVWQCECGRRYKAVCRDGEFGSTWTAWRRILLPHFLGHNGGSAAS